MSDENSWLAWQKVVLAKLEDLDKNQYNLRDEVHALNDILVETVGRSGKNGRLGMLTEKIELLEKQLHATVNANRTTLLGGGAIGGGGLAVLIEFIKTLIQ